MSSRGWAIYDNYPYRNTVLSRTVQWFSSTLSRFINRLYFWSTREFEIFDVFHGDVHVSPPFTTLFKLLVILGILAVILITVWFIIENQAVNDQTSVDSRALQSPDTTTEPLFTSSKDEDDTTKTEELQTGTTRIPLGENYIRPYVLENNSEATSLAEPKTTLIEEWQKRNVNRDDKCTICQSRDFSSVEFRWPSGPLQVHLTGTFLGWTAKVAMTKRRETRESDSDFSVNFILPKGHHEFKFLVEGVWRLSSEYKKCLNPLGEENNCIIIE